MRKHGLMCIVACCFVLSLGGLTSSAQVITGTIFGIVQDESKGAMPGATVTIKNVDTGVAHVAVTDGEGRYRVANLSLGTYRVDAELQGFKTVSKSGITLTVGQEAPVDFTLGVGSLTETVEVTTAAPLVETTKSQLADLVDQRQIAELPLNSRSYTDLALLEPGVMTTSRNASFSATQGGGIKLSISGARPTNTGFYVDGLDTKDAFGRTPGSAAGTTLGVDTIREFQVQTGSFSAQYGGSGGVINAVTKSGTNTIHGDAFWFRRDSKFDASNPFDAFGKAPFQRDQPGFTVGGPIKKDHTFYFVSYEHLSQDQSTTTTINVPSADLRAGNTPQGKLTIDPTTAKFLAAMPLPNGLIQSNGIGSYVSQRAQSATENYVMIKVDQQLGAKDNVFVRFTSDVAENHVPGTFPGFGLVQNTNGKYVIGEYDRIISPTLLNTFRFSYSRPNSLDVNISDGIDPSLSFIPGRVAQNLSVPGLSAWGNDAISDRGYYLRSVQTSERLSLTKGKHAMVAGIDYLGNTLHGYSASRIDGQNTFNSLNDFLTGKPFTWQFLVPGLGSDPGPEDSLRAFHQDQFTFYVQDDVKVRPNFTLNAGVRWEFVNEVTEATNRISNLVNPLDPQETVGTYFKPPKANIGPRVGFAWDLKGDGKSSLRGGVGMFYQPLNYGVWQISIVQNAPFFVRAQINNPAWPSAFAWDASNLPPAEPTPITYNPNNPYYVQSNLTYQRQLPGDMVVSVGYSGSRGHNLPDAENGNPFTFTTLPSGQMFWGTTGNQVRVNPNFADDSYRGFQAISNYNALQTRFSKRFSDGLQIQSSYTFAKALDDTSEVQTVAFMDPTQPLLDYGLSQYSVRNAFSFNAIYQLPFFANRGGVVGNVLGGWQVSGLITAQSGLPLNVIEGFNRSRDGNVLSGATNNDRPNLIAGGNQNPIVGDGRNPLQYADVSQFVLQPAGVHGTLGRDTLIGPGLIQCDASFVKNISFGSGRRVELRAEFFNLLNRVNFGNPTVSAFTAATGPNPNFGRITGTATSSRQGQLAVKFLF